MEKFVTMEDLAKVLKLCDSYLISKYQTSIERVMELDIDNKVETILMLILANDDINSLFDRYNLYDVMYDLLDNYSKKKIFSISNNTLLLSSRRPNSLKNDEYSISEDRLDRVFEALEHNMKLFDELYRDKVWIIDSSLGRSEKISITPTRFFHLMGLDEKDFRDENSMKLFESVFPIKDNIKSLMRDRKDLFKVLEKMLERENNIKQAILDGTLAPVINPHKLEMKNYAFERIGIIEHSSGMIFYDRQKAMRLGYNTRLQTDLILLSNFIRKYNLEFIFSAYKKYKYTLNSKDAESIIIPTRGYENSEFIKGQQVSISERARRYSPKDFEFTIKTENGDGNPVSEPDVYVEFSAEDKARMANAIIKELPYLDTSHLKELYENLVNNNSNNKIL